MHVSVGFDDLGIARKSWITIGNFDGVHRGHQEMLRALKELARRDGVGACVVSFDPPPLAVLRPELDLKRLTTHARKIELLKEFGVDGLVVIKSTLDLLGLTADDFFKQVIVDYLQATGILEGPNFFFGKNRGGDVQKLQELTFQYGMGCQIIEPLLEGGQMISSTRIRHALQAGDIAYANMMLGTCFRLTGRVVHGAGRGRTLGFPTANLDTVLTVVPGEGVYAGRVELDARHYPAAVHIGSNPTFGDAAQKIEVHVLDFEGDLYGRQLSVDLLARLRDGVHFSSPQALLNQLQDDLARSRSLFVASRSG